MTMRSKQKHSKLFRVLSGFYALSWVLLTPVLYLFILVRVQKKKEHPKRFKEKFGFTAEEKSKGDVIWFHAVSMGEVMSIQKLILLILEKTNYKVLITTTTLTSSEWVEKNLPNVTHQFFPIDHPYFIYRFLSFWKPKASFFVDSEVWPNWLKAIKKKQIPLGLLNARLSDKSYQFWMNKPKLYGSLLSYFDLIIPQSKNDKDKFTYFNVPSETPINLKEAADPLDFSSKILSSLKDQVQNRPVWIAASTHHDEEIKFAKLHHELLEKHKDLLLILIPRHANRGAEIAQNLKSETTLNISQRSGEDTLDENTNIYLADTMGEMGVFFRLECPIVIGGSFIPHGGQNPLQAAHFKNLIIWGPYMDNFKEIETNLLDHEAAIKTEALDELKQQLNTYFLSPTSCDDIIDRANDYVKNKQHGTMQVYDLVIKLIGADK